ncbi:cation:proton antiporter [Natrarchaeobaculum sulfurireducens]|uniref:Kef-type transport system 2 (Probable substrate potassium), subunit 2 n=1 Tax=Natrarchaeobaculum sulfurireducens TaxID=2044521 RepID=A0A346PRW7_9EURY|nr:cation:proton antiporter [Natrarchaeobaculum sulfurireducens]AXR82262.1 Kef-type transport system 2 (probable substrate potassium), subunit 2 [Natrarchaeobaculum sulfurireducens]
MAAEIIVALSVMFIAAGLLLLVANHFGLSPIPFYIIAGLLTGPFFEVAELVELAQWGIAFLVFVFGIQVNFDDIRSVFRDAEVAAFTQLLVVGTAAVGAGYVFSIYFGFEHPVRNAIYFGAAATLSSTIVGVGLLKQDVRNNLVHGRLASSIHFFDDMVAIGIILILSAETLSDAQLVTSNIGYGVLFLLAGLLIYRHGFPLLVKAAEGFEELILMGSISILIAFIAAAEAVGISIVIGAFAAGIAIRSDGAQALGVRNGIESIRDFFVAIFFVTVGALVQVPTLGGLVLALALLLFVLVVSPLVHMFAFLYEGYDARTAFLASSSLNQISELSLVIAIQAWLMGTIADGVFNAIILATAATMILTVVTTRNEEVIYHTLVERLVRGQQTRRIDERSHVDDDLNDHVVVVGYGRQGRLLVERLEELEVPYVVVENDPVLADDLRRECKNYVFGDALATYPMERARVDDARLLVSTADSDRLSESLLELSTDADRILRADTSRKAREWLDRGATFVNVPNVLASDQLVDNVSRVVKDERETIALKSEHLDVLSNLERYGFGSRYDGN